MKIFHHDDPDGLASAAIVINSLNNQQVPDDIETYSMSYATPFNFDIIKEKELVFMVDFSLKPDEMERLNNMAELIWIDHHITAIKACEEKGLKIKGIQNTESAGCELSWKYFNDDQLMSTGIKLIGRYDMWDHENYPDALPFWYGVKSYKEWLDPKNKFWDHLIIGTNYHEILNIGYKIKEYQDSMNVQILGRSCCETIFEGHPALACNSPLCNSMLFDSQYNKDKHELLLSYYWGRGAWNVSIYVPDKNSKVDASIYAKNEGIKSGLGGGGHKSACGFRCKELPFKIG